MIKPEYKKIFDEFLKQYEEINPIPFYTTGKDAFLEYVDYYIANNDITTQKEYYYFMNHMIKTINGKVDAHTCDSNNSILIPMNFKIIDNDVLVNYPEEEKGNRLLSINGIPIDNILEELDKIATYGTEGWKRYSIERSLYRISAIGCIPSLRQYDTLKYEFQALDGKTYTREFDENQKEYPNMFNNKEYRFGNPGTYEIRDNTLIIHHTSVQPDFEELIRERYKIINELDMSNINRIIVDIRINTGGNSELNKPLYEFLEKNKDKELIVLTGYRVYSSGRWCLQELLNKKALTIGEEIGTPMNCCGNNSIVKIEGQTYSVSSRYFHPGRDMSAKSKEEFKEKFTNEDVDNLDIFKPDIYVTQTKEDFINGKDTILEYALNYKLENKKTPIK